MGNWNINIQGVGCHHNTSSPTDANRMAQEFVERLKAAGHTVQAATFTHGGAEALMDPCSRAHQLDRNAGTTYHAQR